MADVVENLPKCTVLSCIQCKFVVLLDGDPSENIGAFYHNSMVKKILLRCNTYYNYLEEATKYLDPGHSWIY